MCVARNVLFDPAIVPGGGAVEMAVGKVSSSLSSHRNPTICYSLTFLRIPDSIQFHLVIFSSFMS